MLIYSGLEVPGDDSSVGVDVSLLMSPGDTHYLHNYICIKSLFSKQ